MEAKLLVFNYTGQFRRYFIESGFTQKEIEPCMNEFTDQMKVKVKDIYCLYDPDGLLTD